jgi:two-component system KDP operon response regulator KdpE
MRALWISNACARRSTTALGLEAAGLYFDQALFELRGSLAAEVHCYDLICVGPNTDPKTSMDALGAVTKTDRCPPIIVVASEASTSLHILALEKGAADVIAEPVEHQELRARILAVLRRAQQRLDETLILGNLAIDVENKIVSVRGSNLHFSETEYGILEFLANRANRRVTREAILTNLFGAGTNRSSSYLRYYVHGIRRKLRFSSNEYDLVAYRGEEGYALLSQQAAQS